MLISLAPEYVEHLVLEIRSQRLNQQAGRVIRPQTIAVPNDIVESLLAQPFVSSNRGAHGSMMVARQQSAQRQQAPPRQILQASFSMADYI